MNCPHCGAAQDVSDNFCRQCGLNVSGTQLPMVIDPQPIATVWRPYRAVTIGGAATLTVGAVALLVTRWFVRRAGRVLLQRALMSYGQNSLPVLKTPSVPQNDATASVVVESFTWVRHMIIRR